jgi:hypothetical protein
MPRKRSSPQVREPLQVYFTGDERRLLDRIASDTGLSRAEVLRRGLRSFAREQPPENNPMLKFIEDLRGADWPADLGRNHDKYLAEAALDRHEPIARVGARKKRR